MCGGVQSYVRMTGRERENPTKTTQEKEVHRAHNAKRKHSCLLFHLVDILLNKENLGRGYDVQSKVLYFSESMWVKHELFKTSR